VVGAFKTGIQFMRPVNLKQPGGSTHRRRTRAYGADDPTILRWDRFRTAVRELLADQPSPGTVRHCARRMDAYIWHTANAETEARAQAEKARDAA
jgi:hypothetical protein